MSRAPRAKPVKTEGRMSAYLRTKQRHLKEELDRIYYTLPYDEIQPVLSELKDTVDCLTEMGDQHQSFGRERSRPLRRRAANE